MTKCNGILRIGLGMAATAGAAALGLLAAPTGPAAAERMITVGAAESVRIYPGGAEFRARIDTGATTSSINAHKIKRFSRGGKSWVRFEIVNKQGQTIAMERPVVRSVRIKHFGQESKRRTVVRLGICMGGFYKDAQVTLQDRRRREYPVLIGRRYMAGAVVVDPGSEYLVKPNCPGRR
ncbi:MAG TPA: RimK/LysX family protein [Alphaproteobacteria bacterium]|nr:RimK/LysX family protein [Alphaproteobacteria bacterium]